MNAQVITLAAVLSLSGPALASDKSDILAVVHSWTDGFNKGETKAALANCAEEASIIDDFPPFAWNGAGACTAWFNDFGAWAKKNDMVFDHSSIDKVRHVQVVGDRAYVVLSATFAVKVKGTLNSEKGIWTFGMKKGGHGWQMTGWTWTTP